MKIFLSHSSKNKPLVREVKNYFPEHINVWIDEKDLLIGDDIDKTIKDAIDTNSDFLIIFIDSNSIKSRWVSKELKWALKHEIEIQRKFILPVVLEKELCGSKISKELKDRKYISCSDYTENSIKNLADNIISELFARFSRDLSQAGRKEKKETLVDLLGKVDNIIATLGYEVISIVHPHRRASPLRITDLYKKLETESYMENISDVQFNKILQQMQQRGHLGGIIIDGQNLYVEEEHFSWKTGLFTDAKRIIAKKAITYIKSGFTIALDAGSTTLEVSRQISDGLKYNAWDNLKIVTNSIPAANELLKAASEMGLDDNTSLMKVYMVSGRVRPNTLAVVNDEIIPIKNNFEPVLSSLGGADLSFVGTNGIYKNIGFTTHDNHEVITKSEILKLSKRKLILTDPSKFGIKEDKVFSKFEDKIDIITVKGENDKINKLLEDYGNYFRATSTRIIFA